MNLSEVDIERILKRLHLANARRIWSELVARAEKEEWSFRDFLAVLLSEEVAHRQETRLQRLARKAHFPFLKTIDDFDFTHQSTLRLQLLGSFLAPDFISEGRCLVLSGKTGRGKTHLAVAIGYRAIQNGSDALFVTLAALVDDLSRASREGRMREALASYTRPGVLLIDEVGYLTYGLDAANVLFHVVNERHLRRRPMVFTTNKEPDTWGDVLHDHDLAAAIIDRVLERGRHYKLDGPSIRTRHLTLDKDAAHEAPSQPARISGIGPAEFPEPTIAQQKPLRLGQELVPEEKILVHRPGNVAQEPFSAHRAPRSRKSREPRKTTDTRRERTSFLTVQVGLHLGAPPSRSLGYRSRRGGVPTMPPGASSSSDRKLSSVHVDSGEL